MRTLSVTAALLLFASFASPQSLSEIAKKEKERRKANAEAGRKAAVELTEIAASPIDADEEVPDEREAAETDEEGTDEDEVGETERMDQSAEADEESAVERMDREREEILSTQQERREKAEEKRREQAELADEYESRLSVLRSTFHSCNPILSAGNPGNNIVSNSGQKTGHVDGNGNVRDNSGRIIGSVDTSGTMRDTAGNIIGRVRGGDIVNESGQRIGSVDPFQTPQAYGYGCTDARMKELQAEYKDIYEKLKRLDRSRIIAKNIPNRLRR